VASLTDITRGQDSHSVCKNTGVFVNSDKHLIIEKIIEIRRIGQVVVVTAEHCAFKRSLSISLPMAIVTICFFKVWFRRTPINFMRPLF